MFRLFLTVEYNGQYFCGWQKQDGLISVAQTLQDAISLATQETNLQLICAGRTDAGVHARGQVVQVDLKKKWSTDRLMFAINSNLKTNGVVVKKVRIVQPDLNARLSAKQRRYRYIIINSRSKSPLYGHLAWIVYKPLNYDLMIEAASSLTGTHDFSAFCSRYETSDRKIRTIDFVHIKKRDNMFFLDFGAKSFLNKQVRIMVGTIVGIGSKLLSKDCISVALLSKQRSVVGPTAPPHGLYFTGVTY